MSERNWAGNVTYRARRIAEPRSLDELAAIVVAFDLLERAQMAALVR